MTALGLIGPGKHGARYLQEANGGRYFTRVLSRKPRTDLPEWVKGTTDPEEFFALGLDGVVIATPTESHFEIALEALTRGLHVLCEKPLCESWQRCEILIALAKTRGLRLLVAHTDLFHSAWPEKWDDGATVGVFGGPVGSVSEWMPHAIASVIYASGIEPTCWYRHDPAIVSIQDGHGTVCHAVIRGGVKRRNVMAGETVFDGTARSDPSPMRAMLDVFTGDDPEDERMDYDFTHAVYRVLLTES